MPVRRRIDRRRADDARAWAGYFLSGCDFFDDLEAVGLNEETAAPIAEETWHAIGHDVIRYLDDLHRGFAPVERPIWAEEQYGPPNGGRRRPGTARWRSG